MSILEEIQQAAVDANSDLGTLLRKCKVLAARLGSEQLESWLLWESNGYPDDIKVPEYRVWSLEVKGHFSGPFGSGLENAPIPIACLPQKVREHYTHYECRQSIASIEAMLGKDENGILQVGTGDLSLALGKKVYTGQNCIQTWAEFSINNLHELLNVVRNRILDFALVLWKEEPSAGEIATKSTSAIDSSRVTQIFNTTIYGGSAHLVGTAKDSTIAVTIIGTKDFPSLERILRENEVGEDDIVELKSALDAEPELSSNQSFGPRVASWIAQMIKKAAEGSWGAGVGAAGSLLGQAIAKYYGL